MIASQNGEYRNRFRGSVARIGISLLWKDVSASPGRTLYLATAGAFMNVSFLAPFGEAFFLLAIVLGLLGSALLHRDVTSRFIPCSCVS
jgi:hypothetical protein